MGDEAEFQMTNNSEGNPTVNQDELILAQQRQIEKEVRFRNIKLIILL